MLYNMPNIVIFFLFIYYRWAEIAQSVRAARSGDRIPLRGGDLPRTSRPDFGPNQPSLQGVLGLFPRDKTAGAWHWPFTQSNAEVQIRAELYLCFTQPSLRGVLGLFPRDKAAVAWHWPFTQSTAEVQIRAELYLCFHGVFQGETHLFHCTF